MKTTKKITIKFSTNRRLANKIERDFEEFAKFTGRRYIIKIEFSSKTTEVDLDYNESFIYGMIFGDNISLNEQLKEE